MFNKLNTLEVSQAVGVHRTTIHRWINGGMPRNRDKSFNLPDVISWMINREREAVLEEHAFTEGCDSPALERFRTARAALAELTLRVRQGELVEKDTVERGLGQRALILKSDLQNFSYTAAGEVCGVVRGDASRIPDLIEFMLSKFENLLARYAAPGSR